MKQAIGCIRVSREKQANESVSLDAQEAKIVSWRKANDYELVAMFKDAGVSGALPMDERNGLSDALFALKKCKADSLVVVK